MAYNHIPKVVDSGIITINAGAAFVRPAAWAQKLPQFIDLLPVVPTDHTDAYTELTWNRANTAVLTYGFPLTVNSVPLQLNENNYLLFNAKNFGGTPVYLYWELSSLYY